MTWWWLCDMESKDEIPLVCLYVYMFYIYVCLTASSPYLLVFDDDRVRGTREQMMVQVDLVRHRVGAWASLGNFLQSYYFYEFYRIVIFGLLKHGPL